jgi:hypothetical protein
MGERGLSLYLHAPTTERRQLLLERSDCALLEAIFRTLCSVQRAWSKIAHGVKW